MKSFIKLLLNQIVILLNFLNNHCTSNPKYFKDKFSLEIANNTKKAFLSFVVIGILYRLFYIIIGAGDFVANMTIIIICIGIMLFWIVSFKWHPQVFKVLFNLTWIVLTVYNSLYKDKTLYSGWAGAFSYPLIIFLASGSLTHYLIHAGVQIICLQFIIKPKLLGILAQSPPQEFISIFMQETVRTSFYLVVCMVLIQKSIRRAYNKAIIAEKKKEEVERQKTFLLGFSHELRNLINSVMGNIQLANLETKCPKVKDFLQNAEVCGKLLLHLVNNILDTGKSEIGDLEINPTPTRIYDTLESIWSICSEIIKRRNLTGTMKIKNNIPQMLNIDHYRLTQIFLNLIGNAVKFTDTGSIDITIEWTRSSENVSNRCFEPTPFNDQNEMDEGVFEKCQKFLIFDSEYIVLGLNHRRIHQKLVRSDPDLSKGILKVIVNDSGCGIPKTELSKLFQKFGQVTSDMSKRKLGTGLGLYITRELCQKMNGEIQVFSQLGKGTCFTFCLPLLPVPVKNNLQMLELDKLKSMTCRKGLRAMIVDDVLFGREIIRDFFNFLGIEVAVMAENGLEAYQKHIKYAEDRQCINIITMDLEMPVMDGKAAAAKIREYEVKKGMKPSLLMIVSGNCSESEIKECMDVRGKIRADAFLKKPASIEELSKAICNYFSIHNLSSNVR